MRKFDEEARCSACGDFGAYVRDDEEPICPSCAGDFDDWCGEFESDAFSLTDKDFEDTF